jgi:hypothetical protein
MSVSFEYKPVKLEVLPTVNGFNNVVHKVTWQLVANYNETSVVSEFTHCITFNQHAAFTQISDLSDDLIMQWVLDEIHPSDLHAMRAGLVAGVTSVK